MQQKRKNDRNVILTGLLGCSEKTGYFRNNRSDVLTGRLACFDSVILDLSLQDDAVSDGSVGEHLRRE